MKAYLNVILEKPQSGDEESGLNSSTCSLGGPRSLDRINKRLFPEIE